MQEEDRKFWPFGARAAIASAIIILVSLLILLVFLRVAINWPGEKSETSVLMGILLISLVPILLGLVDAIIERGGVIKAGGVEIDFTKVHEHSPSAIAVPTNVGLPEYPLDSSRTPDILKAFSNIAACDVAIIDLKEGQAWWETRLLVLVAGAVRHRKPEKIVFVAKDRGMDKCFQGWSHPSELLPHLLQANPQYLRSFHASRAAARQWELVEPVNPVDPGNPGAKPPKPDWIKTGTAAMHGSLAFDNKGFPEELFAEKLLAWDLGTNVERQNEPRRMNLARLEELFRPVLRKESIDESWPAQRQIDAFFASDSDSIAVTQNSRYSLLVSRLTILNAIVKQLIPEGKKTKK